ncbi:DUF1699 family protein [Methanolobus halotolerans]|nr:DUF1699 family protein [Methanolobus halotolerans]
MEDDVWSHRKDINEYSEVSYSAYKRIDQYRADGFQIKRFQLRWKGSRI